MSKIITCFVILAFHSFTTIAQSKKQVEKAYINQANGYSQVVAVSSGETTTLYISGQIASGESMEIQIRSVFISLQKQLKDVGADFKDLVKINTYIVNYKPEIHLELFRKIRKELFGDTIQPASTLVGVQSLARKEWAVEMEAIAVIPRIKLPQNTAVKEKRKKK